jgi:hypothetical protein
VTDGGNLATRSSARFPKPSSFSSDLLCSAEPDFAESLGNALQAERETSMAGAGWVQRSRILHYPAPAVLH